MTKVCNNTLDSLLGYMCSVVYEYLCNLISHSLIHYIHDVFQEREERGGRETEWRGREREGKEGDRKEGERERDSYTTYMIERPLFSWRETGKGREGKRERRKKVERVITCVTLYLSASYTTYMIDKGLVFQEGGRETEWRGRGREGERWKEVERER